ncbi:MAG: glycosyltransferase family 2 protein [Nanoarchaeota archaeon]
MLTSVIIPAYNEENYIGKCLESLGKQSFKDFEIIIIDDGSTDKTREIIRKYKKIILIIGEHKGTAFSRNLGAKKAKGEILIFVDADMTFNKDYLKNLVKPILENEKIIGATHENEIAMNTDNIWSRLWGKVRVDKESVKDVKIFRVIRKSKFLEMGGFDSKYGYADDQTFWFKFKLKPVVAENTICYHNNPETLKETFKQAIWIGASWKERFKIFRISGINYFALRMLWIGLPFFVFAKSLKGVEGVGFRNKLRFFWCKFYGYFIGIEKAVLSGEVWK